MSTEKTLWVRSMYGYKSQAPLVVITMPGGESLQMTLDEARNHALQVLECAEAAMGDGFVVGWLASRVGLDEQMSARLLNEFRQYRESQGQH